MFKKILIRKIKNLTILKIESDNYQAENDFNIQQFHNSFICSINLIIYLIILNLYIDLFIYLIVNETMGSKLSLRGQKFHRGRLISEKRYLIKVKNIK